METETQIQPEMPLPAQSNESNKQKPKRGGKRPGAGRKKSPVTIPLKGTSRATLLHALENVDPQLVATKITKLLHSKREIIPGGLIATPRRPERLRKMYLASDAQFHL